MPQNTVPPDIYPLATQQGEAIPFDILRPAGVLGVAFNNTAPVPLSWAEDTYKVASFYSTGHCLVSFADNEAVYANDTLYPDALFVPPGVFVLASLPAAAISVVGMGEGGTLFIQFAGKWASLSLSRQHQRK